MPAGGAEFRGIEIRGGPRLRDPRAAAGGRGDDRPLPIRGPARGLPRRPGAPADRGGAGADPRARTSSWPRRAARRRSTSPRSRRCSTRSARGSSMPMHYKTPKINLKIQPVERFLEALPGLPAPAGHQFDRDRSREFAAGDEDRPARACTIESWCMTTGGMHRRPGHAGRRGARCTGGDAVYVRMRRRSWPAQPALRA